MITSEIQLGSEVRRSKNIATPEVYSNANWRLIVSLTANATLWIGLWQLGLQAFH